VVKSLAAATTKPLAKSAAHAVAQEKISSRARVSFFIVERMTAFKICIDHSKLRPAHEYSNKSEFYNEASGDIPI